jgi:hypothetical protein
MFADVNNHVGVDNKRRCTRRNDNGLGTICDDCRTLDAVAHLQVFKLVNGGILSTALKEDLARVVPLGVTRHVLGLDLLQLLVYALLKALECLSDTSRAYVVDNDIAVGKREAKFLVMLLYKRLAESPIIAVKFLVGFFFRWLDNHQS